MARWPRRRPSGSARPIRPTPTCATASTPGKTRFFDLHLSLMPQVTRYGFLGPVDVAVVEAADLTAGGGIVLTSAVGAAPTFCNLAEKGDRRAEPPPSADAPGHARYLRARRTRPIASRFRSTRPRTASARRSSPSTRRRSWAWWRPTWRTRARGFSETTPLTERSARTWPSFWRPRLAAGMIPKSFLPIQSGVGDIANSVLGALGSHPEIPPFEMYTEVIQDSVVRADRRGARAASPAVARSR